MSETYVVDKVSGLPVIEKDPQAILDYPFKWTDYLLDPVDTLQSQVTTVETGITLESSGISGTNVVVWLSGGTPGQTYRVANRITTVGGRTDERSILIKVKQK
jgi:hypothetical protein